ncbi:sensor histidine kinase [Streptomyces sp. NPDC059740]|uniref:sensor histidine kinase n=1 Tax=Streptomyces sp. NPDC059740 TaxID=3346926 RepID=UPI00364A57D7
MRTVRAKAALGATLVVTVALVAAGAAVLLVLRDNLADQAGLQAEVTARQVASQIAAGTPYRRLDLPDGDDRPVVVTGAESDRVLAAGEDVEAVDGKRVGAPAGSDDAAASCTDDDCEDGKPRATASPGTVDDDVDHDDGTARVDGRTASYRFARIEASDTGGRDVEVRAGAPTAPVQEAVSTVRDAMLLGLVPLLLVVAGVTWLVTRRALRPVEGIRAEMAEITQSTDLSRRVPQPATEDEIGRLARTTNQTLAALETAVERQRAFVADASHELRSPLAALRTQLEVGLAHPGLLDVPGAVADTVRLQTLAADLLLLARLDAGERPAARRLDLGALVAEEAGQRHADRLPVEVTAAPDVTVAGSRNQLSRVLGNLLDNAQRHAATAVRVRVAREGRWAVVRVADDGPGVPPGERERIFERFVRLDDARSRDEGGAGLGLAIARDVAERHGGGLTVQDAADAGQGRAAGGALFVLRLPAVDPGTSD